MKKFMYTFFTFLMFFFVSSYAQTSSKYDWLAQNSWNFGFGFEYPYPINVDYNREELNYGGYLSLQRNFSEHVGLRLQGSYSSMKGKVGTREVTSDNLTGDVDLLYYLAPVEPVSPYMLVGIELINSSFTNQVPATYRSSNFDWGFSLNFGAEFRVNNSWNVRTEIGYHTVSNPGQFGVDGVKFGGLLGTYENAYMTMNVGLLYYFAKGERSHLNDEYEGVSAVDYAKIEDIVKKYQTQPTEVDYNRIEDIVKKNTPTIVGGAAAPSNWVLIGVNFDFNKSTLRPESLPILYNSAEILLNHPEIKVEIQGYSDNVGSEKANQKLSLARAQTVKNFLVAKGVSADRLTTTGMGEANPIMSNKTAEGRALNRRIEFKVLNK